MLVARYGPVAPAEICPTKTRGGQTYPDMFHGMPSRIVTLEEAQFRGWPMFYDGGSCLQGHQAPRYTKNKFACVDCRRVSRGLPPIGVKTAPRAKSRARWESPREEAPASSPARSSFVWTEAARTAFIESYINTGEIESALADLSRSLLLYGGHVDFQDYRAERERNEDFARRVDLARAAAEWTLEQRVRAMASMPADLLAALDPQDREAAEEARGELQQALEASDDRAYEHEGQTKWEHLGDYLHFAANAVADWSEHHAANRAREQ